MSILQRYVLKELLGPLGLGMLVFTFVFLIGQIFKLTDLLLNSGVPAGLATELILSLLPNIFSLTIPMAILLAILMGVGRLAADREILAIRASGVNLVRVFTPIIIGSGVIAGIMMWANQTFVPYLNLKSADLRTQIAFTVLSAIPPDRAFTLEGSGSGPTSTFFYEARDEDSGQMKGVRIHTFLEQKDKALEKRSDRVKDRIRELQHKKDAKSQEELKRLRSELEKLTQMQTADEALILAQAGSMRADTAEQMISIELTSGSINILNPDDAASYDVVRFATLTKNIFPNVGKDDDGTFRKKPREMVTAELRQQIREETTAKKRNPLITEYWRRLSVPLACVAFALIGFPLAVYARPTGKAIAFGISFLLILIYYGLLQYGMSLGKTGNSLAVFAIFFPNILLSAVGAALMYRMVMR